MRGFVLFRFPGGYEIQINFWMHLNGRYKTEIIHFVRNPFTQGISNRCRIEGPNLNYAALQP